MTLKAKSYPSSLHQLIDTLMYGLSECREPLAPSELEFWGILIHDVMSSRWRKYHTVDHIFSLLEGESVTPLQTLGIIFHDLVYLQVDRRIHPLLSNLLPEFHFQDQSTIVLPQMIPGVSDQSLQLVMEIFGLKSGQVMSPYTGANEFLSALAASRILAQKLSLWEIISVAACIETTIPFRSKNASGETPGQQLERRVAFVCQQFHLPLSQDEIHQRIAQAVDVSNRDLMSFSFSDPHLFLKHSWDLVLEGNPVFKNPMHTIREYRTALLKMEKFLSELDPERIYHYEEGMQGGKERIVGMAEKARRNLEIAAEYFQSKLMTVGVLEAIANLTGGDAPIVLFMGSTPQIEAFLDQDVRKVPQTESESEIMHLLSDKGFKDVWDSASCYLYLRLSAGERQKHLCQAKEMFENKLSYREYLSGFRKELLNSIIQALSRLAWTRRDELAVLRGKF